MTVGETRQHRRLSYQLKPTKDLPGLMHSLFLLVVFLILRIEFCCGASQFQESQLSADAGADQAVVVECPVCVRVMRAARQMGKSRQDVTAALNSYCSLTNIEVAEQKFCYNTENVRGELSRMIKLGADEHRICKRVRAMNPDFCNVMSTKVNNEGLHKNDRFVRGVIYE